MKCFTPDTGSTSPRPSHADCAAVLSAVYATRSPATRAAYSGDLQRLAPVIRQKTSDDVLYAFLAKGYQHAHRLALHCRSALMAKGLSPASVNRCLSSLRTCIAVANQRGVVDWQLRIDDLPLDPDDQSPPTTIDSERLLQAIQAQSDPRKAARDTAIVHLLMAPALHVTDITRLTLDDCDLPHRRIRVTSSIHDTDAKGWRICPMTTARALHQWILHRGSHAGPLIIDTVHATAPSKLPLTTRAIHRMIAVLGRRCGISLCPGHLRRSRMHRRVPRLVSEINPVACSSSTTPTH